MQDQPKPPEVVPHLSPSGPARRTRVLCVDDSQDVGEMLARLIRKQPDLDDAGVLDRAEGLVDEVIGRKVDVVVLDLSMPGPDPIEAIRALAQHVPSCRVIAFSGYDDSGTKDEVCRAGAWGLVSKNSQPADILRAIRDPGGAPLPSGTAQAGSRIT